MAATDGNAGGDAKAIYSATHCPCSGGSHWIKQTIWWRILRRVCCRLAVGLLQASPSHGRGHRFKSCTAHQNMHVIQALSGDVRRFFCVGVYSVSNSTPNQDEQRPPVLPLLED